MKIHSVRTDLNPYIIRLGYIRRLRTHPLDVWSFDTHEMDYLLSLPPETLHLEDLDASVKSLCIDKIRFSVRYLRIKSMIPVVRKKRLLRVYMRQKDVDIKIRMRALNTFLQTAIHTIVGFYGVPIKRRGIPADKVPTDMKRYVQVLLMKRRMKGRDYKLLYYFPNVAITPSGKIRYLGNGSLLVIPGRGTKILVNVFALKDSQNKEHVIVEVAKK